jgi:hypothetical protein
VMAFRGFGYSAGNPIDGPSLNINGVFPSTTRAEGTVNFRSYPGCGSVAAVGWTATKP